MPDETAFRDLMARLRAGDQRAAEELFRLYQPQVRLEVRLRLRDPRLRRLVDESDVCQSVLLSFFVRAGLGAYDVTNPQQLLRLLAGMTRNKVAAQARRHATLRRDFRRSEGLEGTEAAARDASPSEVIAGEDLLRQVFARLSEEEQRIADLRAEGQGWAEVAQHIGGSPDARRMQMQRAANRLVRELGLDPDEE
jgi:RNA polymerase sigma-70 factor (ECF subfamily)